MFRSVIAEIRPDWRLVEVGDADQALEESRKQTFDIVLIDVGLPGKSGLELAKELRRDFPDIAMAVITANIQKPVRERAEALGAWFIEKPLTAEDLLAFLSGVGLLDD